MPQVADGVCFGPGLALSDMILLAADTSGKHGSIALARVQQDSLETLEANIAEAGLERDPLEWYLDLRRYGSVPHAGFGIGIERTVAWMAGVHHVREAIAFPRLMDRLYP